MLQSNERQPLDFPRRCVGRQAIERSLRATLIRLHRFYRHRATSPDNIRWAAETIDGLSGLLEPGRSHAWASDEPGRFVDGESEE
jgi:hypothetical protein